MAPRVTDAMPLAPARGVMLGLGLSALLWLALAGAVWSVVA